MKDMNASILELEQALLQINRVKTGEIITSIYKGPQISTHLASGIVLPVVDDVARSGSAIIGFSAEDDITAIKKATNGKICLLENLNGIDMIRWDLDRVEAEVKHLIEEGGKDGGLIISDNHGENPWHVSEQTLI